MTRILYKIDIQHLTYASRTYTCNPGYLAIHKHPQRFIPMQTTHQHEKHPHTTHPSRNWVQASRIPKLHTIFISGSYVPCPLMLPIHPLGNTLTPAPSVRKSETARAPDPVSGRNGYRVKMQCIFSVAVAVPSPGCARRALSRVPAFTTSCSHIHLRTETQRRGSSTSSVPGVFSAQQLAGTFT
jgi:hypothetical protein